MTTTWKLAQPPCQHRLHFTGALQPPQVLSEKHRPRQLTEIVGQGAIVFQIESFVEAPYSTVFMFEGPTGVGKTTVALAIAAELGAVEFGGLEIVKSGMQDAETVENVLRSLHFAPMLGSGWKVVIVDEADYMSPKASQIWLSALEDLPSRSVVIFTTNKPDKFPDRFLDRCKRFVFEADAQTHAQDAQALLNEVWSKETGESSTPSLDSLKGVVDSQGNLSYRRIIRALEPLLATWRKSPGIMKTTPAAHAPTPKQASTSTLPLDVATAAARYRAGEKIAAVARDYGISWQRLWSELDRFGVQLGGDSRKKTG